MKNKMRIQRSSPVQDKRNDEEVWNLKSEVIGEECLWRKGSSKFISYVGELSCKRYLVTNDTHQWWIPGAPHLYWSRKQKQGCSYIQKEKLYECITTDPNPFHDDPQMYKFWSKNGVTSVEHHKFWRAPNELFWLCGRMAYVMLPKDWTGSCTLGIIKPSFFLLPRDGSQHLGIPLYDELKRKRRDLIGGSQKWGEEEWPPERIIETYGPATWAQDGSWGYRTPIYMLNRIIRLQAVLEIITNETAMVLDLISTQNRQMRTAIYQNRLALDYLLAEEGGVCGKFNSSECCIEIDDYGDLIKNITTRIRKLAHVPVQRWSPLIKLNWWDNLLGGEWWKKVLLIVGGALISLILLPCLIPCLIRLITNIVQNSLESLSREKIEKIMIIQENKLGKNSETAKKTYEKYQKLRKIYQVYDAPV
ncbi:endogenous retrovirus group 3 member 1 Env polyprotein-like [Vidua chalybeata]|uniref:endogenous retrovirus group 3 member 1 Env polyprotein-like n=1 Tax=Vidua chalybeata TaxID=81927 RepID=UPI0023A7A4C8|nr:endogenous retrovirus group 3 member 1 Env polyprotein-like [Vidua chalybeata]XP_053795993.1 endogenous retrovirus group 3 member 1 Env polyprotein-like [Vidua chalybeata]XP_053800463.1 endogenous retrovirus group 3 member 1 Env polyprotein-like [Vidua chalybeata]XP_053810259.1 endogenous retrovirus group 3 member 1 Env polyprotein-like [Vidua chalybeata]